MASISTVRARGEFSTIVNRAAFGKERVILTRRGKKLAAVVPIEDVRLLEELENRLDLGEAARILADRHETPIPYKRARQRLGMK
ncbi:MAG TPA: type II toxin-antitoxin system Phd/YefM family antitoxin [Acidobacteriota bacterium]|jgi:prevent-host-death family protein